MLSNHPHDQSDFEENPQTRSYRRNRPACWSDTDGRGEKLRRGAPAMNGVDKWL